MCSWWLLLWGRLRLRLRLRERSVLVFAEALGFVNRVRELAPVTA
jgi:hypothetical protein